VASPDIGIFVINPQGIEGNCLPKYSLDEK
jgi:hypothetical protein